ncbi:MAG TPA: DNA repair protein RecO [Candidatus Saccharimonadales bacterium]|nr:DNA repair protein RecO [Candidatus Saccharimonadales bacterium]
MKHLKTTGIILSRTDYGEADRILTVLTPDRGKLRLLARGVRKVKSKLAGGIELFSTSDITFIEGRGELGTLISTRLIKHYGHIIDDIERVQLGYEIIKTLNRTTEDHPDQEYYELLEQAFAALDDPGIDLTLIRLWFEARLLDLAGHSPNLSTDTAGAKLEAGQKYDFDHESMAFVPNGSGKYTASDIKVLRLLFSANPLEDINKVQGIGQALKNIEPLIRTTSRDFL